VLNGEYRNLTRNKKWDLMTQTAFYVLGENAGDYKIQASIQRKLNRKWGDVGVYFSNVNRSPARLFQTQSVFNLDTLLHNFLKENTTILGLKSQSKYFDISFQNFTLLNFIYYKNYIQPVQYKLPINIIQFIASKKLTLTKRWSWYTTLALQYTDGAAPIKLPLAFTRNRLAYEGKFFRNLQLSTGLELRYYTPFKANDFSPLIGQFVFQDASVIRNRPDVSAFFHFRIRGFAGYLRAENLNTLDPNNAFSFTKNNFSSPLYPTQGLMIRFGIQWWFVN
jgi:hypothetical protein